MADETQRSSASAGADNPLIARPVIRMLGKAPARSLSRRKVCRFCADTTVSIDYKNPQILKNFITDRGKIIPSRITGNCARHQRRLTTAIKQARSVALLPFAEAQ